MKSKGWEFGLFIAGVGVGLALFVAEQAGLDMPTWLLIALGVLALVMIVGGLLIPFSRDRGAEESPESPDPCAERLKRVEANANHLASQLGNFDKWWWALKNDELPDGHPMPRAKAMEELVFRFTHFFSAAWLYEDHCRDHLPHDEVVEWLREVYWEFGKPKKGPTDDRIMSQELHAIGEAGTNDWGTSQVRLKSDAEVKGAMDNNVFDPLKRFLGGAAPDTETLARLEIARETIERVRERLSKLRSR